MKITDVQIQLIKPNNGLIGFASLVIDDSLYLSNIGIHQKGNYSAYNKYRLTYPKKGKYSLFYPINKIASKIIEDAIFDKLAKVQSKINDYTNHSENQFYGNR